MTQSFEQTLWNDSLLRMPSLRTAMEERVTVPFRRIAELVRRKVRAMHPGQEVAELTEQYQALHERIIPAQAEERILHSYVVLSAIRVDDARQRYTALVDVLDENGNLNGVHLQASGRYRLQ